VPWRLHQSSSRLKAASSPAASACRRVCPLRELDDRHRPAVPMLSRHRLRIRDRSFAHAEHLLQPLAVGARAGPEARRWRPPRRRPKLRSAVEHRILVEQGAPNRAGAGRRTPCSGRPSRLGIGRSSRRESRSPEGPKGRELSVERLPGDSASCPSKRTLQISIPAGGDAGNREAHGDSPRGQAGEQHCLATSTAGASKSSNGSGASGSSGEGSVQLCRKPRRCRAARWAHPVRGRPGFRALGWRDPRRSRSGVPTTGMALVLRDHLAAAAQKLATGPSPLDPEAPRRSRLAGPGGARRQDNAARPLGREGNRLRFRFRRLRRRVSRSGACCC